MCRGACGQFSVIASCRACPDGLLTRGEAHAVEEDAAGAEGESSFAASVSRVWLPCFTASAHPAR